MAAEALGALTSAARTFGPAMNEFIEQTLQHRGFGNTNLYIFQVNLDLLSDVERFYG